MPQVKLTMTDELKQVFEAYRMQRGLKTIPEAVLELATLQLDYRGRIMGSWGGKRPNKKSETLESKDML